MPALITGENPIKNLLGHLVKLAQYRTGALQSAAFAAGDLTPLTGTEGVVIYDNTGTTPGTLTTRTAAEMYADIPGCVAGQTYLLGIRNSSGSANTATVGAGTGVTLTGTMTIAQFHTRLFIVTVTSPVAFTFQSVLLSPAAAA